MSTGSYTQIDSMSMFRVTRYRCTLAPHPQSIDKKYSQNDVSTPPPCSVRLDPIAMPSTVIAGR